MSGLKVVVHFGGLISYALGEKRIDALFPATKHHGDGHAGHDHSHAPHADTHFSAMLVPLVSVSKTSSAPDQVIQVGDEDFGLWRLDGQHVEVWRDGGSPSESLEFEKSEHLDRVTNENAGDLFWLPDMKRATDVKECRFRRECFPPNADPKLVNAVVSLMEGQANAEFSSEEAKTDEYKFSAPVVDDTVPQRLYKQPFADGIVWTFSVDKFAEVRLTGLADRRIRSVYLPAENRPECVVMSVSNKPATVGGQSVLLPNGPNHFGVFYDLLDPPLGPVSRRVLRPIGVEVKTNRCPGSAN